MIGGGGEVGSETWVIAASTPDPTTNSWTILGRFMDMGYGGGYGSTVTARAICATSQS